MRANRERVGLIGEHFQDSEPDKAVKGENSFDWELLKWSILSLIRTSINSH